CTLWSTTPESNLRFVPALIICRFCASRVTKDVAAARQTVSALCRTRGSHHPLWSIKRISRLPCSKAAAGTPVAGVALASGVHP
ncbi:unnamed protein product, partial [Ascophyllum nodosum]